MSGDGAPPTIERTRRLGAQCVSGGTWFTVEAPHAERVELCLFEPGAAQESRRLGMAKSADGIHFSLFVPGVGPDAPYGYRAHGPHDPDDGLLFNPNKLLVDPWARATSGPLAFHPSQRTHPAPREPEPGEAPPRGQPSQPLDMQGGPLAPDPHDSAAAMLRSIVVDDGPLRAQAASAPPVPGIPLADTVLYECHVRGMTRAHPGVPTHLRGTYLGLCHEAAVDHLKRLGVTTLSLLPVAEYYDEEHLCERGLSNYWGYAPVCCFTPTRRYATKGGDPRLEFRTMVDTLHRAGLEVLVDVVFNHTAEGDARGTTLALRGLDNRAYYALAPEWPRRPRDHTGCGNSLDLNQPSCLRYVLDALRAWVVELGVDGFRFDLAVTLARTETGFSPTAPFLAAITQDPLLRNCKLIAEPWDVGDSGYRLGGFPAGFSEWNDRFRDTVRRFFRGDDGHTADLATRLAGSSDLFGAVGRGPLASVNFVTSHDGFTLRDLVSYAHKHNGANREDNRDGHDGNFSQNFGHEGPTRRAHVEHARQTAARSMLLCLATAHGVPMLGHGDELGRSQAGNNNAYCQDNALTQVPWPADSNGPASGFRERAAGEDTWAQQLLPFACAALAARRRHPCLRSVRHLHGDTVAGRSDLVWLNTRGTTMTAADWRGKHLAMRICGVPGDGVVLLLNGGRRTTRFKLPGADDGFCWQVALDAARPDPCDKPAAHAVSVGAHSAMLLEMKEKR